MKATTVAACLACWLTLASATADTPVQKVIELMAGMLQKGKAEKHEEQVQFAAYKQFCDDTADKKRRAVEEAEEAVVTLKAAVKKNQADVKKLTKEIAEHNADVAAWSADTKAATKVRGVEKEDYEAKHKDYTESIDALKNAIEVLSKEAHDRPQEEALLHLSAVRSSPVVDEARRTIDAFLEEDAGFHEQAPEASGYEFASHGVIDMMKGLVGKFVDERTALEREESSRHHQFEMLVQDLKAQIGEAEQDASDKARVKAKKQEAAASAKGDLEETIKGKEADTRYLDDLRSTCAKKEDEFKNRQDLRSEELEAISKALEVIQSEAVSGAAARNLPSMVQGATSFVARRSQIRGHGQLEAAQFLQGQASRLDSRILAAAATRAAADPMGKVKKMIQDLLMHLMEEATEEAEKKGWCDAELGTNAQARKEKTDAVTTLRAEIDALEGSIAQMAEDIADLSTSSSDLDTAMKESTSLREKESEENSDAIKDAQDAQSAVAQALIILRDFYEKAGMATSLVQEPPSFLQRQPESPAIFDSPYQGMNEKDGVVGMLQVIQSDFARLEADTKSAEVTAQREYDTFMRDSKQDKAAKAAEIETKMEKKQDEEQAMTNKKADLAAEQEELDAASTYFEKLKPSCLDAGSPDARVARREEEIQSLQQALKILSGEDI